MIHKLLLAAFLVGWSTIVWAQQPIQCPDRPLGDSTNACANTRYVRNNSGSIIVGSTPITSGTNKGLLYNNAGILGNLATANNGILSTNSSGTPAITTFFALSPTNTTQLVANPAFPNYAAGDPTVTDPTTVGVTTTWQTGASVVGHSIAGYVVLEASAPSSGSSYGVIGGSYNKKAGADTGGVLGIINNDTTIALAAGVGVWGLIRNTVNGDNGVDAVRGNSESVAGSHPRTYFYGASSEITNQAKVGMYIQNAVTAGVQIGGPLDQSGSQGLGFSNPTYAFSYYDSTTANATPIFSVSATATVTGAQYNLVGNAFANVSGNFTQLLDASNNAAVSLGNATDPRNVFGNTTHEFRTRGGVTRFAVVGSGGLGLDGSTSGTLTVKPPAIAGTNTLTLPAGTTDFSATGGTSQVVKQIEPGGAFTVTRLTCSDLSDAAAGCSAAVGITALTGDVTASGSGSVAATLATVNVGSGSVGSSTAIPVLTTNGKGLVTAQTTAAVVAPAGTLTGTTLNATVVTSSLTSVGALDGGSATTGFTVAASNVTWSGTVPIANLPVGTSAAKGIVQCDNTTITCTAGVITAIGAAAASITVGTTTIGSGTTTRILYDNAGTLGEYTISGTGTVVAMTASPTFTGTASFAAGTFSTTLGVTGASTLTGGFTSSAASSVALSSAGTVFTVQNSAASTGGGISFVNGDSNIPLTDLRYTQFQIRGFSNSNQLLGIGYDTTGNRGVIQAQTVGTSIDPLYLNGAGGNVMLGVAGTSYNTQVLSTVVTTTTGTGALVVSGGGGFGGALAAVLANTASTSAVCYNTGTGLLTYNATVGTCTVSTIAAKNLKQPLSPREGFDIVMGMEPWRYTLKEGRPTYKPGEQIGMIAEYAAKKDHRLVAVNPDGSMAGFLYEQYTAALTAAFQYLKADNDNLRADIWKLKHAEAR